jgi:hypothetical protein
VLFASPLYRIKKIKQEKSVFCVRVENLCKLSHCFDGKKIKFESCSFRTTGARLGWQREGRGPRAGPRLPTLLGRFRAVGPTDTANTFRVRRDYSTRFRVSLQVGPIVIANKRPPLNPAHLHCAGATHRPSTRLPSLTNYPTIRVTPPCQFRRIRIECVALSDRKLPHDSGSSTPAFK